jgi:hypothetical protein
MDRSLTEEKKETNWLLVTVQTAPMLKHSE